MAESPVLSLITGKVGRDASFQRLVDSIEVHTDVPWELVVSDASEIPYDPALPNIRVIHEKPRLTCVQGYNAAFALARGTWCLYLNDDAEVLPHYASTAIQFMETHPQIGLGALHYSENGGPFRVNQCYAIPYANFGIIRKTLLEQVGFFDNQLKMYGNDNALTFRVLMAGHGVSDIPGAKVLHHSEQDITRTENQRWRSRDNDILLNKYLPHIQEMRKTYNRLRVHTGTVPWVHGVSPEYVGQ